ncbi:hypothetical protein K3495_g4396 [Podosphaera aphanis]|nr:hypothetical protein K3495_g4396 [Podosphaera aphanis]
MKVKMSSETIKVKLYWLEQSRSQRILWLLEELKLPYEIEIFHRNPETKLAGPELKEIHPLGKSPVVTVTFPGSSQPLTIAESGFIVEYLLDHFSEGTTLVPKRYKDGYEGKVGGECEEWMRYRYFLHYAEGSLMTLMMVGVICQNIRHSPVPFFIKPITNAIAGKIKSLFLGPNFATHFAFLEQQLNTSPLDGKYLCGPNLTGVDILMSFPLIAAKKNSSLTGLTEEDFPKLFAYTAMLEEEPGYKRSVGKIVEHEGSFQATF